MIKKVIIAVIILIITMIIVMLTTLGFIQESLIYPGLKREKYVLKEPFEQINDSYFRKGKTDKLWVLLGGNNSLPGDFEKYTFGKMDNFLLVTYPGYNGTNLKPEPETMNNVIESCLKKLETANYKKNFLCYSIGCAVAINYLSTEGKKLAVDRVILLAPFWSIDEIMYDNYYFPRIVTKNILNHNWENKNIENISPEIDLTIIHGKNDKLINYEHAISLSKLRKSKLILTEDDHMSIFYKIPELIN